MNISISLKLARSGFDIRACIILKFQLVYECICIENQCYFCLDFLCLILYLVYSIRTYTVSLITDKYKGALGSAAVVP